MSYSICQRKYLLWAVFDDNDDDNEFINFKINEFRVCDCFLEWTVRFRNLSKDVIFSEEIITDFFDAVPTEMVGYDVFSLFGEITILCCKNALYHFLYKEDLDHNKLADECLGMILICDVCIFLKEILMIFRVSVQIFNLIL